MFVKLIPNRLSNENHYSEAKQISINFNAKSFRCAVHITCKIDKIQQVCLFFLNKHMFTYFSQGSGEISEKNIILVNDNAVLEETIQV